MGAVLSQKDNTEQETTRILFKKFNEIQRKYSAGDLETWAIISGIRKWRTYLNATRKVMNITDNHTLSWLQKQ